jgi:hypothetical protein
VPHELEGLVPEEWWSKLEPSLTDHQWQPHRERARKAPLPEAAVRFYTGAGCWLLAADLQDITQLTLGAELNPWGRALHVFVIDGDDAIDALGRTPIAEIRAHLEPIGGSVALGVDLESTLATLEAKAYTAAAAAIAREMLASDKYRACSRRAAEIVAAETGLGGAAGARSGAHGP